MFKNYYNPKSKLIEQLKESIDIFYSLKDEKSIAKNIKVKNAVCMTITPTVFLAESLKYCDLKHQIVSVYMLMLQL